jgi:hypothetical protein
MASPSGIAAQLGLAEETTYGTFVTPDRFLEFSSETLRLQKTRAESRGLRAGRYTMHRRKTVRSWIEGGIDMELANVDIGVLFEHLLGAVSTTNSTTEYTHVITPGNIATNGLTMQVGRPDDGGTVRAFSYLGCYVRGVEVAAREGEYATARWDIVGQAEDTSESLASASYDSAYDPFASCDITLEIASSEVAAREVSCNIQRALTGPRHRLRSTTPTAGLEPLDNGLITVSGAATIDFEDLTDYNRFVNDTQTTLSIIATGATIDANPYKVQIDLAVEFDGETPNVSGPENLSLTLPFTAIDADDDDDTVTVTIVDTNTAP